MSDFKNQSPWGTPPGGGGNGHGFRRGPRPPDIYKVVKKLLKKISNKNTMSVIEDILKLALTLFLLLKLICYCVINP